MQLIIIIGIIKSWVIKSGLTAFRVIPGKFKKVKYFNTGTNIKVNINEI